MKRIPVTQSSYKKIPSKKSSPGKVTVSAKSGPVDKNKTRQAASFGMAGASFNSRAGMLGTTSSFYNSSYMSGGNGLSAGMGDIPLYFAFLNEQNGGVLYYPTTLKERYEWYRYFARNDAYVSAAVKLHTDLPMSRLVLRMPKMKDREKRKKILSKYENMVQNLRLFDKLHSILFEVNVIGNCFCFIQFSEEKKEWDKISIFPPEEVSVSGIPMSDISRIEYKPGPLGAVLAKHDIPFDDYDKYCKCINDLPEDDKNILQGIDMGLAKQIKENDGILSFDTNPYSGDGDSQIGSFVFHFTEKRHEYHDLGASPLECVLTPLLMKEHYKHTQLSLASRNMTPRNVVTADGISIEALDELRDQVDQSMLSPDYSIVTNYQINWETIGAENRLIDLQREYETIENQIFAGLGVTRELLTGEGLYSGNKISIEILNTRYLLKREMLQRFVEESLFKPLALENGFYEDDKDGNRKWLYPRLSFSRLTIRDNSEVFDSLFQLYQKGSIPVGTILDLFNLDEDEVDEKLRRDMFTPKDAVYNDMLRGIYSDLGSKIVESTDLAQQIAENMVGPSGKKLELKQQQEGEDDGGYEDLAYDNPGTEQEDAEELVDQEDNDEINTDTENEDIIKVEEQTKEETSDDPINDYINGLIKKEEKKNDETEENKEASFRIAKTNRRIDNEKGH